MSEIRNTNNENKKHERIVVVGGVAGGASAATRARRMNEWAEIVLLEKDGYVSFANCGLPYYLGGEIVDREELLVAKPELLRGRFGIDVRTHHEAVKVDRDKKVVEVRDVGSGEVYELGYDKLVLSPGAKPIVPKMGGVDAENVFTLRNVEDTDLIKAYLDRKGEKPRHMTVVGAGFIGLEMVEQLVEGLGVEVMLVELQEQVLPLLDGDLAVMLEEELVAKGVDVRTGVGLSEILQDDEGKVRGVMVNGEEVATDMVLLGIGVAPNHGLAAEAGLSIGERGGMVVNEMRQTDDAAIYGVGDASEYVYGVNEKWMRVPLAGPANRSGRIAGTHAAGVTDGDVMPAVMGTSAVRVFGLSAALTGMSLKAARGAYGDDVGSVTVTANDHVGYYPGATPIVLRLVYLKGDGRVIGAQAIGQKGIDKRIDVVATLMHMKGTARDLAGVDLVYAPPFGAAKDVVHQAAFAACNELDGLVKVVQIDEVDEGFSLLDVRAEAEVRSFGVAGAVNVPVDELRERIGELDAGKKWALLCGSGQRSYVAARILMQRGFADVWNVTGGVTGWVRSMKARGEVANA